MSDENIPQPEDVKDEVVPETAPEASSNDVTAEATAPVIDETVTAEAPITETTKALPYRNLKPGMLVRVHETIKDVNAKGVERERVQVFEGTILGFSGSEITRTMTVRKVSDGIGVEKVYPLSSPHVTDVEVVREYQVRRAKLWFLRQGLKRKLKEVKKA